VNAAGPWVKRVLNERLGQPSDDAVRLVRGSHIVVPRLYEGEHAFILQNEDRRVVFMIPYEERFTLVGTTDVPLESDGVDVQPSQEEIAYLCRAASRYLAKPLRAERVVWQYSGVRPLYDDGSADPSEVTRDYTLRLDGEGDEAPVLSVYGGKITTYRRLAEQALEKLGRHFPRMAKPWTDRAPLPGSAFSSRASAQAAFFDRHPQVPRAWLRDLFRRHGALADEVVGNGNLGEHYGAGLTEREVRYFVDREWARSADDVLWRRSKCGLHMTEAQCARLAKVMGR
jgi:glycerol-3-phosphate dehydrogenase